MLHIEEFSCIKERMTPEDGPQLTLEQRRLNLIGIVRKRLLQKPSTMVSHFVANPDDINLSLRFEPSDGVICEVDCWPDRLHIVRKNRSWSSSPETDIEISPKQQYYNTIARKMLLDGEAAMAQTESDIETFLPPQG